MLEIESAWRVPGRTMAGPELFAAKSKLLEVFAARLLVLLLLASPIVGHEPLGVLGSWFIYTRMPWPTQRPTPSPGSLAGLAKRFAGSANDWVACGAAAKVLGHMLFLKAKISWRAWEFCKATQCVFTSCHRLTQHAPICALAESEA
eukprot:1154378-Pelagomonas_calceolata.AAC.2